MGILREESSSLFLEEIVICIFRLRVSEKFEYSKQ